jgi:hypothetical protein
MRTVATAPLAIVPSEQVTGRPAVHDPCEVITVPSAAGAPGSRSVSHTSRFELAARRKPISDPSGE